MPNTSDYQPASRRVLTVFYVLDTSGSMAGAPITTLNNAMSETIEALRASAKSNADAQLKIAVMQFSSDAKWVTQNGPEELEKDFFFEPLKAGGLTAVGAALQELDKKLSRSAFLNEVAGNYLPVIIFMSDGMATDEEVLKKALPKIRGNKWFKHAMKIGFALGDSPDLKMISEVVGNAEAVIRTDDLEVFAKLLKFASVTSTMLASTSQTPETSETGADIVQGIMKQEGLQRNVPDNLVYDKEPEPDPEENTQSTDGWGDDGTW